MNPTSSEAYEFDFQVRWHRQLHDEEQGRLAIAKGHNRQENCGMYNDADQYMFR